MRYGWRYEATRKPFVLKYGGMAYREEGAGVTNPLTVFEMGAPGVQRSGRFDCKCVGRSLFTAHCPPSTVHGLSSAFRSHLAQFAAASYVLCKNFSSASSGSAD